MTKIWKHSEDDETRTEGAVNWEETDWVSYFDRSLGVSRQAMGNSKKPAVIELIEPEHPPDDYFWASGWFVVSDRLKQLLEHFSVQAEFLEITILSGNEEIADEKFHCCNVLDAVDCFDHTRGVCTFHEAAGFTDHIDKISKLAIDESKAASHHLFCIAKGGEHIICASDALVDAIRAAGLTGMRFASPDSWPAC